MLSYNGILHVFLPDTSRNNLEVYESVTFSSFTLLFVSDELPSVLSGYIDCEYQLSESHSWKGRALSYSKENRIIYCPLPPESQRAELSGKRVSLRIEGYALPSHAVFETKEVWRFLVFDSIVVENGVLVFAKGLPCLKDNRRQPETSDITCLFDGKIKSRVSSACQEGVICEWPSQRRQEFQSLTLKVNSTMMPSVVNLSNLKAESEKRSTKVHFLCICTVVQNVARFLKEWIIFHAHLGVTRFFLYDNNSDDNIVEVLNFLEKYNISRYFWPWPKSQEAGFSHCTISSSKFCEFTAFIDVDEFLFPSTKFLSQKELPPFHSLIQHVENSLESGKKIGSLSVKCLNYGPSGLSKLPSSGQAVNYICRERSSSSVKSIIRNSALNGTRCNVIHRFRNIDFSKGFVDITIRRKLAVVNHYKFSVWDDFKLKFKQRVSTYRVDWTEEKHLDHRDREGFGTKAIKPTNWENQHCFINDTGLKNFMNSNFWDTNSKKYLWEM